MTGGAANKETKYSLNILTRYDLEEQLIKKKYIVSISSPDMTGGAANKETKYSLNILIRYDWRSS